MIRLIVLLFVIICLANSCQKPPVFPDAPVIEFVSMRTNSTNLLDTITMVFKFTDGDGDIGVPLNDTTQNIFLTDLRTNYTIFYRFPNIEPKGNSKSISGELRLTSPFLMCRPLLAKDTITYTIQVKDMKGNKSNLVTIPSIFLTCQ